MSQVKSIFSQLLSYERRTYFITWKLLAFTTTCMHNNHIYGECCIGPRPRSLIKNISMKFLCLRKEKNHTSNNERPLPKIKSTEPSI